MKLSLAILTLLVCFQTSAQHTTYHKTLKKLPFHYLAFRNNRVIVYKMGSYLDKAGSGPAVILMDTLKVANENQFKGNLYTLFKSDRHYTLLSNKGKKLQTEPEPDTERVNEELNNAYCLKSHYDLSSKINSEFPLYHYSFRNAFQAWNNQKNKKSIHHEFIEHIDNEIKVIYDSISKKQTSLTKTSNFIIENAGQANYASLTDSLKKLPIDFRPRAGYFDESVYRMSMANPVYFYKLLQDFPLDKKFIYFAVEKDKELIKQLKQVQGYDALKKEFLKVYKSGKRMPYMLIGGYALLGGLLTWLIISQK